MFDTKFIDDLVKRLSESVPQNLQTLKSDLEKNFKAVLKSAFSKLELVTREEFDVQKNVLLKTREKVDKLEKTLEKLDHKHTGKSKK